MSSDSEHEVGAVEYRRVADLAPHPECGIVPLPSAEDRQALYESIAAHGVRDPLDILPSGEILDGRTRWEIAGEQGISEVPVIVRDLGPEDAILFISASAICRRHLTSGQKTVIQIETVQALERLRAAAAQRQREGNRQGGMVGGRGGRLQEENSSNRFPAPVPETYWDNMEERGAEEEVITTEPDEGGWVEPEYGGWSPEQCWPEPSKPAEPEPKTDEREASWVRGLIAKDAGVSPRTVQDVLTVREKDPELYRKIGTGEIAAKAAARIVRDRELRRCVAPFPQGKYAVIYADPPWEYSNSGLEQSAASHYPTMSLADICRLPVTDLCEPRTVLFLWVTAPLLIPNAQRVLEAWGFQYKELFIWDKGRMPGMGWWVRQSCEFLVIGTRKDSPHPAAVPDAYFRFEPGRHSAKPEYVYEIIESMYPDGPYIELFARTARQGWERWGAEAPAEGAGQ